MLEYQKSINLLENTPSQRSKLRTKLWIEISDGEHITLIIKLSLRLRC